MDVFKELPMGLAMALAKNPKAMKAYSEMDESEQQGLIDIMHTVTSKKEMQSIVEGIAQRYQND